MNFAQRLVAVRTLVIREITRILRIWPQTLLPPIITMSLYFVIFGQLIGERIGEMKGHPYITFIVPGLIMLSVITNSYSNVVSSFFSAKFQRNIEEILISPMSFAMVISGFIIGGMFRGLVVGLLVSVVALGFTKIPVHNVLVVVAIILMTSALFALGGLLNAIFAKKFDDINIFPTFVLTPLTYLGGIFYSIDDLPQFWQQVSLFNPILYMVNAFRFGFLGFSDMPIVYAFSFLAVFIVILFFISYTLLKRGYGIRT